MRKITNYVLYFTILLIPLLSFSQGLSLPFTISGFNADVIANGIGTATTSTNNDVDGVSYAFKSLDWKLTATSTVQVKGFPLDGVIHSLSTPGLYFKLAPYDQNNSIRLATVAASVTSNLTTTYSASKIHILTTGGSGSATLGGTITFTDNTTQTFSGVSVPDWYATTGLPQTYINFGRINISTNAIEDGSDTNQPRLFQGTVDILAANQTKIIQSITFTKSAGSGIINIFAVSAEAIETCTSPFPATVNVQSAVSANISWTAPTTAPQNGYQYEVRSSGMPGSGSAGLATSNTVTGITTVATGLQPVTKYYLYIRSVCTSGNGIWKWAATFTTPCAAIPGNFSENFDTTPVGTSTNPTVPSCWTYLDDMTGTGYGYTQNSATYASSGSNSFRFYIYNAATNNNQYLYLVSPLTNNLGNGTKQIRFSARYLTGAAKLEVVRLSNVSSPAAATSSSTVLVSFNVDQLTFKEYIVPVPATTDNYFAFRVTYDGNPSNNYPIAYIDDVYFEDVSPCIFPMNISAASITTASAVISWNASLAVGVTGYEYEVRSSGNPGSGAAGLVATGTTTAATTTANITGLNPGTNYKIYVRSICGTANGIWTTFPHSFNTLCGVVNAFFEGFETTTIGSSTNNTYPLCWSYVDTVTTSGYGYVANSAANNGNNGFYTYRTSTTGTAYDGDVLLISPETNNLGSGAKRIRFWAKVSSATYASTHKFEVYSMNGTTSTSTKTLVKGNIQLTAAWQEIIINLPVTTDDYFAFSFDRTGGASYVYIDDIYYEDIPPPTLTTSQMNNICYGGNAGMASVVVANGALPLTYLWNTGATTPIINGLTAGVYTVTVKDALNRTATVTVTVTETNQVLANATINNITCNGLSNGNITLGATGGTAPYTYLWNTGATGSTLSGVVAGTYSVTITDVNGCTATESATITEPAVLTTTNSAQTDVSWYGGNDGSATVLASGGTAPYTYSWSNGGTTATISGLIAGTYTVTVTDANGCTSTLDFVIIQPIPLMVQSVSQTNVSCNAGANGTATIVAMGGNAPYIYAWSPTGGTSSTASGLSAGTYSVLVTDSTGNTITESYTITEPAAIVAATTKTDITCNFASNGTATVSVTGGTAPYTYFWSNGMTSATATNLNVGTYSVQITDANGCKATATVSITQPAALVATVTSTNITCFGQIDGTASVSVTGGTSPYTYAWSNGQVGTSLTGLSKGTYTLTVTDANGCTSTKVVTITEPAFVYPPIASNQNFCIGQNATLTNVVITGSNIKWYSAATAGVLLPSSTVLTNGTTYYASQTVGSCESATRAAVQVTLNQGTPLTTTQLNVCGNTRIQGVMIDGFNYTQLKWYSSATSTAQLASSLLLSTGTYYVSSVVGTCESSRQAIQVTVAAIVPAPTAAAQTACGSATLNDLTVVKDPSATLRWYSSLQSITPLSGTTQVSTGTYYVQQVIGNCESVRIAVPVQVVTATVPTMTSITTCDGTVIGDLHPITGKYVWYVNNTTTTSLPDTFVITSGSYYIAHEVQGCISSRVNVAVNVGARPTSPTGQTTQSFGFAARISDLVMNQPNVSWYASYNDALMQLNELGKTTTLQDTFTYYGILKSANNCGSYPTAVTVSINVSTNELDLAQLKYYPNPVDSELNINYIDEIKKVEVFTITGQRVFGNDYQSNEVKVDLSRLSAGTYLVKIETAKASQFVKIVKR